MSSSDNQKRYGRKDQGPDDSYIDDEFFDDAWDIDLASEQAAPPQPTTRAGQSPKATSTSRNQPAIQGTAAQIERLRRNLGQQARTPSTPTRQPAPASPSQQTGRYPATPPADDMIVSDDPWYADEAYEPPASSTRQAPSSARRSSTPQSRQPRYTPDPYVDSAYDEPYDDEQYLDYEDDFSEYDAPRPPARAPRPQIRMPAISRPTLPPAIANADLVNDAAALGIIGVAVAGLTAMAIVVGNRASSLAPEFATHVSASGVLEDFKPESYLWNLPLMATMFTLMNIVIAWFVSPHDRFASRFALVGAVVVQFVAWVALIRIL